MRNSGSRPGCRRLAPNATCFGHESRFVNSFTVGKSYQAILFFHLSLTADACRLIEESSFSHRETTVEKCQVMFRKVKQRNLPGRSLPQQRLRAYPKSSRCNHNPTREQGIYGNCPSLTRRVEMLWDRFLANSTFVRRLQ